MADLSAYVNFSVELVNEGNGQSKIVLTDINDYTNVAAVNLSTLAKGYFKVTQPDGGVVMRQSDTFFDVYYNGTTLQRVSVAEKELRLDVLGTFQKGNYIFEYTVECTGYTNTVITKTFNLQYTRPELETNKVLNAYKPEIILTDITNYTLPNFTHTLTRLWSVDINTVLGEKKTATTSNNFIDVKFNAKVYDAYYEALLTSTVTWTSTNTWLKIKDVLTDYFDFELFTPSTLSELMCFIKGENYIRFISGCKHEECDTTAAVTIEEFLKEIQVVYNKYKYYGDLKHTNDKILPYDFTGATQFLGTIRLAAGTGQWTATSNLLLEKIAVYSPTPITVRVGTTVGGDEVYYDFSVNGTSVASGDKVLAGGETLYFTGINSNTIITLYTR